MAGAERITGRILEDAQNRAKSNILEAEKKASDIIRTAEEEARKKQKEIIDKAFVAADERKNRMISIAELEGRKEKLKTKQAMISEVFNKIHERLNSISDEEYEKILVNMVVNSVRDGDEEVLLSEKDKNRISSKFIKKINNMLFEKGLKGKAVLSPQTRDIRGGFILKKGDVEINNSFEAIIKMQRDELEELIVAELF
ncbi:MAG: V-type ATP synthase subunit E [Acetivibrionales bacterium]|jgi:V/A-type H+-transporting ATPase subunit E